MDIFPNASGREEGYMVGLSPGLESVIRSLGPFPVWSHVTVAFVWGMLLLIVLLDLDLGVGT